MSAPQLLESSDDVPLFIARKDRDERVFDLSKEQIVWILEWYGVEVPAGAKKGRLLSTLIDTFKEGEMQGDKQPFEEAVKLKELELQNKELEIQRLRILREVDEKREQENERVRIENEKEREEREKEREERERERKERVKEREHELQVLRLKNTKETGCEFNVASAIKLVPLFIEDDVTEFFSAFEKIANKLEWPKPMWTTLVQCRLVGKAQKLYVTLSEDTCADYDQVKTLILKAYELVPEAYRQKFRNLKKDFKETHVEFARQKEQCFDDWCRAKGVNDFSKLRELVLVEEFRSCVSREIKLYTEELKIDTLNAAAVAADEYVLSHRNTFRFKTPGPMGLGSKGSMCGDKNRQGSSSPSKKDKSPHKGQRSPPRGSKKDVECYFCRRRGHMKADCIALKKFLEKKKPVSLVSKGWEQPEVGCPQVGSSKNGLEDFKEFLSRGKVCEVGKPLSEREILVLRDTGAAQSLICRTSLPKGFVQQNAEYVLLGGFPETVVSCPLEVINIYTNVVQGPVKVAVVDSVPVEGVDFILANDLAAGRVGSDPCLKCIPEGKIPLDREVPYEEIIVPIGAVTRAARRKKQEESPEVNLEDSSIFNPQKEEPVIEHQNNTLPSLGDTRFWDRQSLIREQEVEFKASQFVNDNYTENHGLKPYYTRKDGVLFRVSRACKSPAEESELRHQIVVPSKYRRLILQYAHEHVFGGHQGVQKTFCKISELFYWPKLRKDVKQFVKTCHECQMVGNPNAKIPKAPLIPIPSVGEPFEEVVIDVVGPLPRTKSGNEFILTIMDRVTRYPEAIPLRSIKSHVILDTLLNFFTKFGLPRILQSDCGKNFTSRLFKEKINEWGIKHQTSVPYHPESQGVVERFHQTLKSMIKKYCDKQDKTWDKELPYLLFAIRSAPNDSLGFTPFELVFGHKVRGPLDVICDYWQGDVLDKNLLDYVTESQRKLQQAWSFSKENLIKSQSKMKKNFDVKTKQRNFEIGEKVLVLLPVLGHQLQAKFSGPYKIVSRDSKNNYVIETPNRKQKYRKCHVNMMKPYYERWEKPVSSVVVKEKAKKPEVSSEWPQENSVVLKNINDKLKHLTSTQREQLKTVIFNFPEVTKDVPGYTDVLNHDVDVGDACPIKQCPYRVNPEKSKVIKEELDYMLKQKLIQPSLSPWSSPVVLVKKESGQYRFCIDYRKVNSVTKTDSFPLPRLEDCIDRISNAKYLSKFDLLKGYWQVPLTDRAREISAFVTNEGLYECLVMPFGFKNSACTFQRLMNIITRQLAWSPFGGCVVYIDDVVVFSDDWETHVRLIQELFFALRDAGLVINLAKCDFVKAEVTYLGHVVGHGQVLPKDTNIRALINLPTPTNRREVRRFIGMAGFYRKFVRNLSDIILPLTNLLKKGVSFKWTGECEEACQKVKSILTNYPLLRSPDFSKPFSLAIDASDHGVGAVLLQKDEIGEDHPVAYFSKKLSKSQQAYSTIEKETLSLVMALEHFETYLVSCQGPVVVWTDHNPLLFINKFKNKNQRLTRWSLLLQEWDLEIRHVKGQENVIPDILSRS